jgi:SAM-dependent methyltransferase
MRRSDGTTCEAEDMYDALAPHYRKYSENRGEYLQAIDDIIISRIPEHASSLLDVGAGDGYRAVKIAQACGIDTIVLAEPSTSMVEKCRMLPVTDVWQVGAEHLSEREERFDVILCLWNVLGHIQGHAMRIEALENMKRLLSENGLLLFDVNNRYNARAYGWLPTIQRMLYDSLHSSEQNGDVSFEWHIGEKAIPAMGHFFTPKEAETLVQAAGLVARRRYVVEYATGTIRPSVYEGQLLYELVRRNSHAELE